MNLEGVLKSEFVEIKMKSEHFIEFVTLMDTVEELDITLMDAVHLLRMVKHGQFYSEGETPGKPN